MHFRGVRGYLQGVARDGRRAISRCLGAGADGGGDSDPASSEKKNYSAAAVAAAVGPQEPDDGEGGTEADCRGTTQEI